MRLPVFVAGVAALTGIGNTLLTGAEVSTVQSCAGELLALLVAAIGPEPLIALALFLDIAGLGAPVWWLAGKSLEFLLAIARWTAVQPGAVNHLPAMGEGRFVVFVVGALWLAHWRGRVRLLGLVPAIGAELSLLVLHPPDLLI